MPSGELYATYHLLWEPETTIEGSSPPILILNSVRKVRWAWVWMVFFGGFKFQVFQFNLCVLLMVVNLTFIFPEATYRFTNWWSTCWVLQSNPWGRSVFSAILLAEMADAKGGRSPFLFWEGNFSGAMLNFRWVDHYIASVFQEHTMYSHWKFFAFKDRYSAVHGFNTIAEHCTSCHCKHEHSLEI